MLGFLLSSPVPFIENVIQETFPNCHYENIKNLVGGNLINMPSRAKCICMYEIK